MSAWPILDTTDIGARDYPRAECVAQVMEAQGPEAGALERAVIAAAQRRGVDVAAGLAREYEVVVGGPVRALA